MVSMMSNSNTGSFLLVLVLLFKEAVAWLGFKAICILGCFGNIFGGKQIVGAAATLTN
ncbi:hypothetical protein CCACVL1_06735 [Corchorus capsularis]|uniref:Uncharacterized protein n=1 Tax=Corchorus capsularis TaxID=210143 RepID=A0A1R3JDL2_COCAP|nr:hypothetical protein CCACVL1_06735 [Corchorus capsularis]